MPGLRFRASLVRLGNRVCMLLPRSAGARLGAAYRVPVRGTLNGYPVRTSVFRMREGVRMMLVNREMREQTGAGVGDRVDVALEIDLAARTAVPRARARARSRRAKPVLYRPV